jgi:ABC-type branched-subunit amino acid transport system substrate-binding protein
MKCYSTLLRQRVRSSGIAYALGAAAMAAMLASAAPAQAQKKYGPGASDTEIKIGNIMPYSGPASAYATIGKVQAAYFKKVNEEGGINGRKINFVSYDDAYSPPKAIEQARKLVESDEVLLIFQPLGTPSNSAIQKYMNTKKVPQLLVATGATKFGDPKNFPGRWGGSPPTRAKAASSPSTFWRNTRIQGSPYFGRMTTPARMGLREFEMALVTRQR